VDSGGPLEFVEDGVNGRVCAAAPEAVANAIGGYASDRALAAAHGERGHARASTITWSGVIERLIDAAGDRT
jgi:glycosyltransferase involved in cell wall biosynthesis